MAVFVDFWYFLLLFLLVVSFVSYFLLLKGLSFVTFCYFFIGCNFDKLLFTGPGGPGWRVLFIVRRGNLEGCRLIFFLFVLLKVWSGHYECNAVGYGLFDQEKYIAVPGFFPAVPGFFCWPFSLLITFSYFFLLVISFVSYFLLLKRVRDVTFCYFCYWL